MSVYLQSIILFVRSSGVLHIMIVPMRWLWRPVIALKVHLGTWWLLWVLLVPFLTCTYDLLVYVCHNSLLDTKMFYYLWSPSKNENKIHWEDILTTPPYQTAKTAECSGFQYRPLALWKYLCWIFFIFLDIFGLVPR